MGGLEDDWAGGSGRVGFYPAGGADAPLVAGFEAWEAEFGAGGREIVAGSFREGEEFAGELAADRVAAVVVRADAAGAVAVETGDRIDGAGDEGLAEDIEVGGHGG